MFLSRAAQEEPGDFTEGNEENEGACPAVRSVPLRLSGSKRSSGKTLLSPQALNSEDACFAG
jgi:hypothetical protein